MEHTQVQGQAGPQAPGGTVPKPRRIGRRLVVAAVLLALAGGAAFAIKAGRWYVIPRRFQEIEPGLFRSAQLECGPYERVVEEHKIRSVLRLYNKLLPRMEEIENKVIADYRLELLTIEMPGDGLADFGDIDRAADLAADPAKRPMLVHCASGDRRSSAVHAAFRMRHCGWTWERTAEELERFGLDREDGAALYVHLERYAREHLKKGGGEKR